MERLSIDEVIEHCKRNTQGWERAEKDRVRLGAKPRNFETDDMSDNVMKEYWEHRQVAEWLEQLKSYKDAEENGLLLKLPCKRGTELFAILNKCRAMVVSEEDCDDESSCLECPYKKQFIVTQVSATKDVLTDEYFSKLPTYIWGKTLFATQEEAEQKLKELQG